MTVYAITDTKKGRTGIAPTYLQTTPSAFQHILPTLIFLLPWTAFTIHSTGPDLSCFSIYFYFIFSLIFLFVLCGGLSWLHLSFLLHVKYTVSYRIVSYELKPDIRGQMSMF